MTRLTFTALLLGQTELERKDMNNFSITVTGVDERTPLSAATLNAEVGILYSATPEGRNRYPRFEWIRDHAYLFRRASLHICGSKARAELLEGRLTGILSVVQRVQVNGALDWKEVNEICARCYHLQVITQHNKYNRDLLTTVAQANHQILVDASGGRAKSPAKWDRPETEKTVGFAGGLGPDNLAAELQILRGLAAGEKSWVDMEGKLRVDDWFSVEKAKECISIFESK